MAASDLEEKKIKGAIRLVTDRMLDARMTLSTVDPAGVMMPMVDDANAEIGLMGQDQLTFEGSTVNASFNALVSSTGGSVVKGRNDLDRVVGTLAGQDARYYTLSYVPTGGSDERREYRHIRIEMKDPSLHGVTRRGYYSGREAVAEVAPNTVKRQPQQLRFDLMNAARSKLVYTGLHVTTKPAKDGYMVLVDANDLRWQGQGNGTRTAEVSIVGVAFDAKGKELGQKAVELKQEIGEADRIDGGVPVGFAFGFAHPARTARVRVVVRDAVTGNLGSADVTQ